MRRFSERGGLASCISDWIAVARKTRVSREQRIANRVVAALISALACILGCSAGDGPELCTPKSASNLLPSLSLSQPPGSVVHLTDCPIAVVGNPRPVATPQQWSGASVRDWTVAPDPSGVLIKSPDLSEFSDHTIFAFELRAPGASEARATPILKEGGRTSSQRLWRMVRQFFDSPLDSHETVRVSFDLTEAIHGNWLDETRSGYLTRIEVHVVGADAESTVLESVTAYPRGALFGREAAAVERVDRGGIVRPSWFVHGGARVRVTVPVPASAAELRWHGGGAARRVRIVDAGWSDIEIAGDPTTREPWVFHSVSLDRWSGREITLEFATEGDGIGFFGDPRIVQRRRAGRQPFWIVYMIDTLRADRLGAWGSKSRALTPTLNRLAAEGAAFKSAISTSAWTKPAIPTLMTGILPSTHGVGIRSYADRLPESVSVVQQVLRDAGWHTVSVSASPLGSSLSGLDRGFGAAVLPRHWRDRIGERNYATASDLHEALLAWHAEEPDQPAFAYVHTIDVHQYQRPYYRGKAFADVQPYDAAVREADAHIGELVARLEEAPEDPELTLVVVSDHGESFGDHGMHGHGRGLYQTQIHVPLIFWSPGRIEAREIRHPVGLADLAPTLLEMAGLSFPGAVQGRSLVPDLNGSAETVHSYLGASLLHFPWEPEAPRRFALVSNEMKKIIASSDGRTYAFDLNADPEEESPMVPISQPLQSELQRWIAEQGSAMQVFQREHTTRTAGSIDAAQAEQLRELGYIE